MCVAVRKKLQLYFWKDREFHELQVGCFCSPSCPNREHSCSLLLTGQSLLLEAPLMFRALAPVGFAVI